MFKWLKEEGYVVDIKGLKEEYPELQDFGTWLKESSQHERRLQWYEEGFAKTHHFTTKGGCENWFTGQWKAVSFMGLWNEQILVLCSVSSRYVYHRVCLPPFHLFTAEIIPSAFSPCCCYILLVTTKL